MAAPSSSRSASLLICVHRVAPVDAQNFWQVRHTDAPVERLDRGLYGVKRLIDYQGRAVT